MTDESRAGGDSGREWLSIQEASTLMGVSAATLRRWSDAGEIRAFTTPGGHRRFARSAVQALLPATRRKRPTLARLGETPEHLVRVYHRELSQTLAGSAWISAIGDEDRGPCRDHGRRIAGALLNCFDAESPDARSTWLAAGCAAAGEYGRIAGGRGIELAETVEVFLRFRMPLLHELASVAERRGLETCETAELLVAATEAIDALLRELMRGHAQAAARITTVACAGTTEPAAEPVLVP